MKAWILNSLLFICLNSNAQNPFVLVHQHLSNGEYINAHKLLDSCYSKDYYRDSVLFYKGLVQLKENKVSECKKTCEALSKNHPAFSEVHYLKGLLYFVQENYGKSANEFTKVIKSNPNDIKSFYNRSVTLGMMENYLEAIEDLGTCIKLDPNYSQAYYSRAYWYEYTGNYPEASKDYHESIRLNPKNFDAYLGLAFIYQVQHEGTKACEIINKAIGAGSQIAEEIKEGFCR